MSDFLYPILSMMPPSGGSQQEGGSMWTMLIMFGAIILIMYFLMIRPQQKRQKEHQKMIESIKHGDKVITTAGMHGTVSKVDDKSVTVQVADNVQIQFEKSAISQKK